MLDEFLTANRQALVTRCRDKVARRTPQRAGDAELRHGVPVFLEQLVETLRLERTCALAGFEVSGPAAPQKTPASSEIGQSAAKHGSELLRQGFTVDQVVHDYGDLCQAITELALEQDVRVTTAEFRTLNRCLDNAIADAVTEFGRQRDNQVSNEGTRAMGERLGMLAHELRNLLDAAMLAVAAIKAGEVGLQGATGAVLDRSLTGLRLVIDRSLADVRLSVGMPARRQRIALADLIAEAQVAGLMEAQARGRTLTVSVAEPALAVDVDRQMLSSAIANLLQNALKFTRVGGHVSLSAHRTPDDRLVIEIADECGGLPAGTAEKLFRPFEQHGADRSGVGLGLSIARRSVEANGGMIAVRDLPGRGCVFSIELPLSAN
jgi:signal transduction histidine kinase